MNIRLPTIILALLLLTPRFCFATAKTIQDDKIIHAGTSSVVEWLMMHNKPFCKWKPWQRALFTTAVIGGGKEWYDARHPANHSADWGDIAADAVGAFGAEGVMWIVHKTW